MGRNNISSGSGGASGARYVDVSEWIGPPRVGVGGEELLALVVLCAGVDPDLSSSSPLVREKMRCYHAFSLSHL